MPTLKEILADKTNYGDQLAWTLGNGVTVTLAQLRSMSTEDQSTLTKREEAITKAQTDINKANDELKKAQINTANLYTTLQAAEAAIKAGRMDDPAVKQLFGSTTPPNNNNNNDPFAALSRLENDTLMGPIVAAMKKVAADAQAANKAVADNIEVQKKMATNYMNGVLEDRYDRVVPADKQDKFPLATLIQEAVKLNAWSSDTVPDIRRAYKALTAADTQAATVSAAVEAETKKIADSLGITVEQLRARVANPNASGGAGGNEPIFVAPPQSFGLDVHNRSGAAPQPFKNLDEAFAAAAKDKDIWSNVDRAN